MARREDRRMLPMVEPPTPRSDAVHNRELLLIAAAGIVAAEGVPALSMERVAAEAGVGVGTVYRRFGSLQGLLYALIDDDEIRFQRGFMQGPPPFGPGAPPVERIRAFLHRYLDRLERQGEIMARVEASYGSSRTPPYATLRHHLATLVQQADPKLDSVYTAEALLAILGAGLYLHQRHEREMAIEEIQDGLDALLQRLFPGAQG